MSVAPVHNGSGLVKRHVKFLEHVCRRVGILAKDRVHASKNATVLSLSILQGGPFFNTHGLRDRSVLLLPLVQETFFSMCRMACLQIQRAPRVLGTTPHRLAIGHCALRSGIQSGRGCEI